MQRMEQVYGALKIPVWKKHAHLKEVITIANNATVFVPKKRNGNANSSKHSYYAITCCLKCLFFNKVKVFM